MSGLGDGVHLVTVRVALDGTPSFFTEVKDFFVVDRGAAPDAGVTIDGGASGDDAGVVADAGTPDLDPDRDGVPSDRDLCPSIADPAQSDFDADGAGDACDLCPETVAGAIVDASGCAAVDPATADDLAAIVDAILEERFEERLDVNADGAVDAVDYVLRRAGRTR